MPRPGAGMDIGGGLAFSDTVTGLSLDLRVRTLLVHQAEGFSDRGMSLSFGWDPLPSSPLGLTATVAPSWGGSAMGGAEALWNSQMSYGAGSHQMYGSGGQVNAEVGYGLPLGLRFVGTPGVGSSASSYGRELPHGLFHRAARQPGTAVRSRRGRATAGEPADGRRQQRRDRPGQHRLVELTTSISRGAQVRADDKPGVGDRNDHPVRPRPVVVRTGDVERGSGNDRRCWLAPPAGTAHPTWYPTGPRLVFSPLRRYAEQR